jgi:hypothetical protein
MYLNPGLFNLTNASKYSEHDYNNKIWGSIIKASFANTGLIVKRYIFILTYKRSIYMFTSV